MPSMFMFASQLNAEMVYCILQGITRFSKVSFSDQNYESQLRITTATSLIVPTFSEDGLDAIVSFDSIKVKAKDWSQIKSTDL